jgi:hypothetical protein
MPRSTQTSVLSLFSMSDSTDLEAPGPTSVPAGTTSRSSPTTLYGRQSRTCAWGLKIAVHERRRRRVEVRVRRYCRHSPGRAGRSRYETCQKAGRALPLIAVRRAHRWSWDLPTGLSENDGAYLAPL